MECEIRHSRRKERRNLSLWRSGCSHRGKFHDELSLIVLKLDFCFDYGLAEVNTHSFLSREFRDSTVPGERNLYSSWQSDEADMGFRRAGPLHLELDWFRSVDSTLRGDMQTALEHCSLYLPRAKRSFESTPPREHCEAVSAGYLADQF
ncbi:hypothetical protein MPTK2_4g01950 [Marchantia polymorpha subsp. ruderalis]